MRFTLVTYRRLISARIRSQLQYRTSFALDLVTAALITVVEFGSLALVLQRFKTVAGWTLSEVAFLYGMIEIAYALVDLLFGGFDPDRFGPMVQRGTLDQLLLKPVNITVQVMGLEFMLRRLGRAVLGIAVLIAALTLTDIHWTLAKTAYLPIVILSQMAFFAGLFIIGSTTTFWTVQRVEIINIFTSGGKEVMSYPMTIFTGWIRRFFTYILPVIFLSYCPISLARRRIRRAGGGASVLAVRYPAL
jgi:ABC-2 type transport system permease protein